MQLVFYTRVSTKEQGNSKNGLEAQLAALQGFADAGGHEVAGHYLEVLSGAVGLDERVKLRLALAKARQVKGLLMVSRLDRLSRSVAFISALMAEGVKFATVEDGLEVEPFVLHMKAVIGEHERLLTSKRTRAALQAKKARGELLGAHTHKVKGDMPRIAAMGGDATASKADAFAHKLAPVLTRMVGQGMTYQQIADELNAQGNPTPRGGLWYASSVCNIMKRLGKTRAYGMYKP